MSDTCIFPLKEPIIVLIGPTAVGKTALSIQLAKAFDCEIISVDSMQVYRYMDIGTAKIRNEEMENIPHHLIDVVDPDEPFDAGIFEVKATQAIHSILNKGKRVLITGGTGLYLTALVNGLSPELPSFTEIRKDLEHQLKTKGHKALHQQLDLIDHISARRIHENDSHRVVRALEIYLGTGKTWASLLEEHKEAKSVRFENILTIGLTRERSELYGRIEQRSSLMLENGFEEEVRGLLNKGYGQNLKSMRSIGYSHMSKYIKGDYGSERMLELLTRDTRRYAKRQYTWFNKIKNIQWMETKDSGLAKTLIDAFL